MPLAVEHYYHQNFNGIQGMHRERELIFFLLFSDTFIIHLSAHMKFTWATSTTVVPILMQKIRHFEIFIEAAFLALSLQCHTITINCDSFPLSLVNHKTAYYYRKFSTIFLFARDLRCRCRNFVMSYANRFICRCLCLIETFGGQTINDRPVNNWTRPHSQGI